MELLSRKRTLRWVQNYLKLKHSFVKFLDVPYRRVIVCFLVNSLQLGIIRVTGNLKHKRRFLNI